jgi:hypothetical protein
MQHIHRRAGAVNRGLSVPIFNAWYSSAGTVGKTYDALIITALQAQDPVKETETLPGD